MFIRHLSTFCIKQYERVRLSDTQRWCVVSDMFDMVCWRVDQSTTNELLILGNVCLHVLQMNRRDSEMLMGTKWIFCIRQVVEPSLSQRTTSTHTHSEKKEEEDEHHIQQPSEYSSRGLANWSLSLPGHQSQVTRQSKVLGEFVLIIVVLLVWSIIVTWWCRFELCIFNYKVDQTRLSLISNGFLDNKRTIVGDCLDDVQHSTYPM